MTRAALFFLGIAVGVLLGAACVVVGFNLGSATAAGSSRPAPVVLMPLPRPAAVPEWRIASEPTGADQGDPVRRPPTTSEPSMLPGPSGAQSPASAEGGASARLAVHGIASWYGTSGPGIYAAAGPALRVGDWRGRLVEVCAASCVAVRLLDWCACGDRPGGPTVIDLSVDAFARLAPPSRGLVEVTVTW